MAVDGVPICADPITFSEVRSALAINSYRADVPVRVMRPECRLVRQSQGGFSATLARDDDSLPLVNRPVLFALDTKPNLCRFPLRLVACRAFKCHSGSATSIPKAVGFWPILALRQHVTRPLATRVSPSIVGTGSKNHSDHSSVPFQIHER